MIEPDINDRMAQFAPSQNPRDPVGLTPDQVEFAQSIRASVDTDLKSSMLAARKVNPDQAARAAALGSQIGVGADIAVRNMDEVEQRAYMQRLAALNLSESDPTLARFLANRQHAMVAHDDVEALHQTQGLFGDLAATAVGFGSEVYQAVTEGTAPRAIREAPRAFESGVQMDAAMREARRVRQRGNASEEELARVEAMQMASGELMEQTGGGFVPGSAMLLGQIREPISISVYRGAQTGLVFGGAAAAAAPFTGGASMAAVKPAMGIGFTAGFTASMVQDSYENIAGIAYVDMRRKGISEENAQFYSGIAGIAGASLEVAGQIPIFGQGMRAAGNFIGRAIADRVIGRGLVRAAGTAVKDAGLTMVSEAGTESGQVITDAVALHMAQRAEGMQGVLDTPEGRQKVINDAIDEGLMVAEGMTLLSLPLPLLNFAGDVGRLRRSQQRVARLQQAINVVANSKMAQRDPDAMQALIDARTGGSPETDLYIDGAQVDVILRQSEVDPRSLDGLMPGFSERLAQAVATGGDIRMTSGEFLAKLALTDTGKAMAPHLRVGDPNDMSALSQKLFRQEQVANLEAIRKAGERAGGAAKEFAESVNRVEDEILAMVSETGQFTQEEARAFANLQTSFVVRVASELGQTPEQVWAQHRNAIMGGQAAPAAPAQAVAQQPVTPAPDAGIFDVNNPPAPTDARLSLDSGGPVVALMDYDGNVYYDRNASMHGDLLDTFPELEADMVIDGGFIIDGKYKPGMSDGGFAASEAGQEMVRRVRRLTAKANTPKPTTLDQKPVAQPMVVKHKREKTTGRYVGAPDWIGGNPRMLVELRKKLRQLALEGESGRMWYENSSRAILEIAGGDVDEAEKIVSLIAIYSPNATVPANTSMALTAYFQWKAGEPINAGFSAADKKAEELLRQNKPWSGIKTNSFYQNLMVEIDPSKLDEGVATMDMWMALAFDYGSKALDQGPKYKFSEREIQRLASELGWTPHQVQAAIWTAMKGRIDPIRGKLRERELELGIGHMVSKTDPKTGKVKEQYEVKRDRAYDHFRLAHKMGMEYDLKPEDVAASRYDFSHALRDRMVQMSWEATPSTQTGRSLPGIHAAPIAQKLEYLQAVRAAINENGRNVIADMAGLPQGTTIEGYSAWLGEIGAGAQTFVPVPSEGSGKARAIKPVAAKILDLASNIYGFVMEQDAVVYHTPVWDDAKKRHNGVQLTSARPLTHAEMQQLYGALHAKFGTWDLAPAYRPDGARVLNFTDIDNAAFHSGLKEVIEALPDDFGGGTIELETFRSDGNYISNDWTKDTNGEGYLAQITAGQPDLLARVVDLRARVEAVNRDFAARYGWDTVPVADAQAVQDAQQSPADTTVAQRPVTELSQDPQQPSEPQGTFDIASFVTRVNQGANISTLIHESGHYWLEVMGRLAVAPDAPARIAGDFDRILQWFGIAGATPQERAATWNSMTLEQKRPHHEAWARNVEIYMAEGKAPSVELQPAFERFMQWMKRLYVSIRDQFNEQYRKEFGKDLPMMSTEVREVMERILASDEQIARAKAVRSAMALFDVRPEGMGDAEWEALQEMQLESDIEAIAAMRAEALRSMKWLRRAEKGILRDMQKETDERRAEVRAEVAESVAQERVYRAREFLSRGRFVDAAGVQEVAEGHRLDIDAVRKMYEMEPEGLRPDISKLGTGAYGMMGKGGINPEVAAEMFGYDSADQMVRDLISAPPIEEAIEAQTDRRMLAENGTMNTPAQREAAVDRALHGELRARLIATQLRLVAKVMQPVRVLQAAAKQVAKQMVAGKKIRDIRVREYVAAESRAARDAAEAYQGMPDPKRAGDAAYTRSINEQMSAVAAGMPMSDAEAIAEEARQAAIERANARRDEYRAKYPASDPSAVLIAAKRNELLNHELAREAMAAQEEVDVALEKFRRMFRPDERLSKTRDINLVNAARAVLAHYGLGKSDKSAADYLRQVKEYDPELHEQLEAEIAESIQGPQDWRELTIEEFRQVRDAVFSLWHNARRRNQVRVDGRLMDLERVGTELTDRVEEIGVPNERDLPGRRQAMTKFQKRMRDAVYGTKAFLQMAEHWTWSMDKGSRTGPFTRYIWRPVMDAIVAYRKDRNRFVKKYVELVEGVRKHMRPGKIVSDDTELGYTFGSGNGGVGISEILGAMQHAGNTSSLTKLLVGRGWGTLDENGVLDTSRWDRFLARMFAEGIVTKEHMDFLQAGWDLNEEMKPLSQEAHYELYGHYFKEIEPREIVTPFGTYRGGYMPAKVDPSVSTDSARLRKLKEIESDFKSMIPTTGRGHTKGRVKGYNEPLLLDIGLMSGHIEEVIRFAHIQPAVRDVSRVLQYRPFKSALKSIDPSVIDDMLVPWLMRSARQTTTEPGMMPRWMDNVATTVRKRAGINLMFGNLVSAMQQPTGLLVAALKVHPRYLSHALLSFFKSPFDTASFIVSQSDFMDQRLKSDIFEMKEAIEEISANPSKAEKSERWIERNGYFLQRAFQNVTDIVVWIGAYNQALADAGVSVSESDAQREARQRADAAVRMTQGSTDAESVSRYQVGSPMYKTLVQFTTFFNLLGNVNFSELAKVKRDVGIRKGSGRMLYVYLMGFAAPTLLADAIVRTMRGQWDDEDDDGYADEILDWLTVGQLRGLVAMVPLGAPIMTASIGVYTDSGFDDRITSSPTASAIESATVGVLKAINNAADPDRDITRQNVRDVLTLLNLVTGVPIRQIERMVSYQIDVSSGDVEPTGTLDYIRGTITGTASEASKR